MKHLVSAKQPPFEKRSRRPSGARAVIAGAAETVMAKAVAVKIV